ncbi:MAG: UDP-N-acetylglucosamine--N-acetylmuramyl-(pentapeptide) pyrophosphoryl-undecaprenol N-acetylglucosamine transferase [Nitratiruptor sp.]|nr:UDP-N-acetylglucosamine--N-acetylmuramyl-(pentapeptide) pyrophosphoryl-undecaprenol N-acetylglucosamine transferase [Nitratiruptor sp.]NPA83725.1 UDP-N-acetylglucosamine--N-acetylmuramyl-(pentapeptide) pyrophosphoryl-undecaprenol N-acetylglucosamine transferase [Campylobacterota bacterium]
MILITGGGTGGHLSIAKALQEAFLQEGIHPIFVGSTRGQDRHWFQEDEGFRERYFLPSKGVVNQQGLGKLATLAALTPLIATALRIIKRHRIKAVVSVGGYSAAPAALAAPLARVPLFIHEQNAQLGRLNQLLRPVSHRLFCSFLPPYDPYPIQSTFFQLARRRERLERLIFLGGSQGATQINEIALQLAPRLQARGIQIIHQCGWKDFQWLKEEYGRLGIEVDLFPFAHDLATKMAQADLAISRAGASTLWELAANGLPALLCPYPHAAGDHQRKNAHFFIQRGGALEYHPSIQLDHLDLASMSQRLLELAKPGGAKEIVGKILEAI